MEPGDLFSLFLLGLFGTGHCLGMCGPLVLAIPGRQGRFAPHLTYHAGRILTYTAIGAFLGGLSMLARNESNPLSAVVAFQVTGSLVIGAVLGYQGLTRLGVIPEWTLLRSANPQGIPCFTVVKQYIFGGSGLFSSFLSGLFLGFLPCGLSFAAFSRALAAPSASDGAALTLAFGLGTLPGLLLLGTTLGAKLRDHRRLSDLLSGMLMLLLAADLVVDALSVLG